MNYSAKLYKTQKIGNFTAKNFKALRKIIIVLYFVIISYYGYTQHIFSGKVIDYFTREPLAGVNIIIDSVRGTISNDKGEFIINLSEGKHSIEFRFLGYKTLKLVVDAREKKYENLVIKLEEESKVLDEIVISAGKFEQKKSDVSVSIEIIKPVQIEDYNILSAENILQKAPGIMIMEKQASIRGGSGFSYGAGSRVMLFFDDLPLLTGASNEAIWDIIPVENISQIEIIKGASSALYGASALNGIVNIKTNNPSGKPFTVIKLSEGSYGTPKDRYKKWWGSKIQNFGSFQFYHSFSKKDFSLSISGNFSNDDGYRENDNYRKSRIYSKIQYNVGRNNNFKVGSNILLMMKEGSNFFLWKDEDTGVYMISPSFRQQFNLKRIIFDPYLLYNKNNVFQSLKTRFYRVRNINNTLQSNTDYSIFTEYRYQRFFEKKLVFSSGILYSRFGAISELYGNTMHKGSSWGIYTQIDKKFNKFSFSAGVRWEKYNLDTFKMFPLPVVRIGINYKIFEYTKFRASFGQGFRYPSIAEKFTQTSVGSLNIFPNPKLSSETGWSAEAGLFQGYKIGKIKGYVDLATFWTQYQNMTEFSFGIYNPDSITLSWNPGSPGYIFNWIGFSASNAENARITGFEGGIFAEADIEKFKFNFNLGYTYMNPITLNTDSAYLATFSDTFSRILKYRVKHQLKSDIDIQFLNLNIGLGLIYFSRIINIDKAFENLSIKVNNVPIVLGDVILPGLRTYRMNHNQGSFIFDFRIGMLIKEKHKLNFIVKNILNTEYMLRPGDVQAPVNYSLLYSLNF